MTKIPRLNPGNMLFVFIDLQQRLLAAIPEAQQLVSRNALLIKAARQLEIPCIVTTQYRKGLGELHSDFAGCVHEDVLDKTCFSCGADATVMSRLTELRKDWVILSGVETHICVLQTALDLLEQGHNVAIVADATGARRALDHEIGLRRMERSGASLVTSEMVLYEAIKSSDSDAFKKILPLVKA